MRAYCSFCWVKGKQNAATSAAARVTLRCFVVSRVMREMSPARLSAVKPNATLMM
ncbi:hypothetical protein SCALM49S_03575 [Streptomyces californicus]